MEILGSKFREARKQQRLSQSTLAAGICTQATVSKIENKNRCESLDIFYSLCSKLGVVVDDFLVGSQEQELVKVLDDVEKLCILFNYKEAYLRLESYWHLDVANLTDDLAIRYLYYKGRTSSNGIGDYGQALDYLNQATGIFRSINIYSILSVNAIAITYILSGKGIKKAARYFDKAYQMLQEFPESQQPVLTCFLYYSLAKYFSELKEYQKSIELCDAGIKLNKKTNSNFYLDALLYEKAYNQYHLNGTTEGFKLAYYFTDFLNHKILMKAIIKNMTEYKIKL